VFWTPKMIKAHFDFLTMHLFTDAYRLSKGHFTKGQVADIMPAYVRARAAMQFAELAAGVAGMMMLLKALPDDVVEIELDPRSSDIGTAKVGNTRIDLTGGKKALITLAARLITRSSKSSTTGKVTDLTLGNFMSRTGEDFIMDAVSNKYSPVMGEFMQYMSGTQRYAPKIDGKRQKYSPAKGIARQFIPLSFTNAWELINDPDAAPFFAAVIAEGLGASTNTYPTSPPMTRYFRTEFSEWVEIPYKKAKAEDKPIPPKAEMNFRRMGKVNDLLNELDNEAEVQKTPSARVATIRARQEVMATSALANKPVFSAKFQPVNKDELKFAYSELWHARAEKTLTGKAWSAHRAALVAAGRGMKATGKLEKKALGTVKAWYTTRHGEALKAGDVDAARAYLDARVALGVKTRDIKKNISAWSMNDDLYDAAQNRKIMETFNKANK